MQWELHEPPLEAKHLNFNQTKFRSETSDDMEIQLRERRKKIQLRESQKKEDTRARNVRKVAKCCAFRWLVGWLGRKVGSLESGSCLEQTRKIVARSIFTSQNAKELTFSEHFYTFGSPDVEKLHAAVAQSKFSIQNVQNTAPSHFWTFRREKIAHGCSLNVKRISSQHVKRMVWPTF